MLNVTRRTPAYADGLRKLIVRQTKAGCYPPALGPASDQRSMSARGDGGWLIWSILARPSTQHTRASHSPHAQTGPLYGWAISERIQQILEDTLQVNQGSLYPALHRLEHQGWIKAEWGVSSRIAITRLQVNCNQCPTLDEVLARRASRIMKGVPNNLAGSINDAVIRRLADATRDSAATIT